MARLLTVAGIALGVSLLLPTIGRASEDPVTIDEPGVYRFADLGWSDDVVLTHDSPRATLQFALPDDARQDAPDWYGVYIEFTWEGRPGPGGVAFLEANWNTRGVVQVQVKRPPIETFQAMEVSTVDLVNGHRLVDEVSSRITASSTNYATYGAIKGGTNTLELRLDPSLAPGREFTVTISNRSAVFRDARGPTEFEVEGAVTIEGLQLEARIKGRNTGLPVSSARLAMAIYSVGSPPQQLSQPLVINPEQNRFEVDVRAQLTSPPPMEVRAWVEWGAGRSFPVSIWPQRHGGSALDWVPYTPWTSLVALVVAWIAVPAAWRRLRHARRQFTVARLPPLACSRALSSRSGAFAGSALSVVVALTTALPASAHEGPYAGLPADVVRIAEAVRAGEADAILAALTKGGEVTRTAYPGSGGNVSLDTARQDIRGLIVSDSSKSDSFGGGSYTLVAIWIPAVAPARTLLVGSGIGPDGVRVSTVFTVESLGGVFVITAYGRVPDPQATLQQFEEQGDLRRVPPGPPATGSAGLAGPHMASAQEGGLPCPGMMNVVDDKFDTSLRLTGRADVTARAAPQEDQQQPPADVVTLFWNLGAGSAKCIWIQRKGPGEGDYPSFAIFVLRPDQTSRVDRPGGIAGEYCYRIFAVSDAGRSRPVESCVDITMPQVERVFDGPAPGAPDAGAGTASGESTRSGFLWLSGGAVVAGLALLGFPALRRIARH